MNRDQMEKAEADALLMTVEELREEKQNREDQRQASLHGVELWEYRWRKAGRSEPDIEAERRRRWAITKDMIHAED